MGRAVRQQRLLRFLRDVDGPANEALIAAQDVDGWRQVVQRLADLGWIESRLDEADDNWVVTATPLRLNEAQQAAVRTVVASFSRFRPFVLDGVTGSGKTEVYLEVIRRVIADGKQALVLVPEIGLTPQTLQRFADGLKVPLGVYHSAMTDQERFTVWAKARANALPVVIGTRSAVWMPLENPGVIIVDEEHDLSYKQQDGFRYCARDLSILRASREGVPVVLGSATPSIETLCNVRQERYTSIVLTRRAGGAHLPRIDLVDLRGRPFNDGLSIELTTGIDDNLSRGEQSLLFLNRRGYSPSLLCHDCGWVAECDRCDANLVFHQTDEMILCHHCGAQRRKPAVCPECGSDVFARGVGTQRITQALGERFPNATIARIDRDSTRRKGALQDLLLQIHSGAIDILIGTQMLAKGHHFPNVSLVGILDADGGLFGVDFRAAERMAQLITQVAGRAGRGTVPGRVLIQTHHPDHPMLNALLANGYKGFSQIAMSEREVAELPPFSNLALLRAEANNADAVFTFLNRASELGGQQSDPQCVSLLGPVPSPMERKAGRFRAQLLVQSADRVPLHHFLRTWLPRLADDRSARRVRWSIDVDPRDMV